METYGMKFTLKNYINLGNKGFTFMELMIAMTVAALTILFFVTTQTKFQLNAETAYERKVATQDAHRFLEQVAARGVAAVVVEQLPEGLNIPALVVPEMVTV